MREVLPARRSSTWRADPEAAIDIREESLQLNPANGNAVQMLERLRGGAE